MSDPFIYVASELQEGKTALVRQHSFTRWMSGDLMQAMTDFCKNVRLVSIYAEYSPETGHRTLLWHPPEKAFIEVRSKRTRQQFQEIDLRNAANNRPLVSLHIDKNDNYSAVWISAEHLDTAKAVLAFYGITPAQRKNSV